MNIRDCSFENQLIFDTLFKITTSSKDYFFSFHSTLFIIYIILSIDFTR